MNIWILVFLFVLVIVLVLIFTMRKSFGEGKFRYIFLIGVIIPLLVAISWIHTLRNLFQGITYIDLSAGLLLGIITGFFLAVFLIRKH